MKIFDERGATLYEMLAVLVISSIILPIIYGVFTSGYKLYNKIGIEGQLRDDADYTATMIMNTFYSFPFDYVRECGEKNCIELVNSSSTALTIQEKEQQTFYSIHQSAANEEEQVIRIEITDSENDSSRKVLSIDSAEITSSADFSESALEISCSESANKNEEECAQGMIDLMLKLDHERLEEKLELNSKFGF
ncbi:hypothetical protein JGK52_12570 [Cytobacillus oceanisediminis]|uniref:hypothetical protein n=1 Tax=Cytobacillus oceanisediminis TaxID=665099 RepID=UPI001D156335|nr:hypothetical protein [Cytobacillus oceanisediminis]MCC3647490.1 hypothetical protein [Cytobacillus oceanisediminis]